MKTYIIPIVFTALVLSSCFDEVLDPVLTETIPINEAVVDLETLNVVVLGTYSNLQGEDAYGRSLLLIPEILSDNAFIDGVDNTGRYLSYDNFTISANDGDAEGIWEELYQTIANASIAIRRGEALEFADSEIDDANRAIGEAYALRALCLLNLQQFFAQPYNFTSDASHPGVLLPDFNLIGLEEQNPTRSTTAEVYTQIVFDLQSAIDRIPEGGDNFARIGQNAAKALLARTYLQMGQWTNARDLATEIIEEGGYELVSSEDYIESWAQESSSETIFSVDNTEVDNPGLDGISYFYLGYVDAFATQEFIDLFDADDIRLELYPLSGNTFSIRKFPNFTTRDDSLPVIRLSEVYLIKAEAHARLNQDNLAQQALDIIIQRANPAAAASTETGTQLLDKIITERRKELAFEGFRLFDLTRTGSSYTKYRQNAGDFSVSAPADNLILPIPITEINANPNVQQNPGY